MDLKERRPIEGRRFDVWCTETQGVALGYKHSAPTALGLDALRAAEFKNADPSRVGVLVCGCIETQGVALGYKHSAPTALGLDALRVALLMRGQATLPYHETLSLERLSEAKLIRR